MGSTYSIPYDYALMPQASEVNGPTLGTLHPSALTHTHACSPILCTTPTSLSLSLSLSPRYVQLIAEHRMTGGIRRQIGAFLEGFREIVTPELISIFNENELELLISGMPNIDLADLKANTEYHGCALRDPIVQVRSLYSSYQSCAATYVH